MAPKTAKPTRAPVAKTTTKPAAKGVVKGGVSLLKISPLAAAPAAPRLRPIHNRRPLRRPFAATTESPELPPTLQSFSGALPLAVTAGIEPPSPDSKEPGLAIDAFRWDLHAADVQYV